MVSFGIKALALAIALFSLQPVGGIYSGPHTQVATDRQASNQNKPLRLRTDEVLVDAIVLDKKNRVVTDLTPEDFEIYEDGAKQKITSFRYESHGVATDVSPGTATGGAARTAARPINLTSLVFDAQTTRDG